MNEIDESEEHKAEDINEDNLISKNDEDEGNADQVAESDQKESESSEKEDQDEVCIIFYYS